MKSDSEEKHLQGFDSICIYYFYCSKLGNFVKLVDQIVLSRLVKVAHYSITTFVHKTMVGDSESTRDGLFDANLVFGTNGE